MEKIGYAAAVDVSSSVKFLCSFGGNILPRPLDGRLRYVGGETRIVTVPRKVSYKELMARAHEIYEGVSIIKYQQPDEDVDALVSVVNDDDVMNMMEEYDKLCKAGNGVTWLRIFLFSHTPPDHAPFEPDERENERRYIDALNSLNDANPRLVSVSSDQSLRNPFIDGGNYNQHNLHQLSNPLPIHAQRFTEMDACNNPTLFSLGQQHANDPSEFALSPSSSRLHLDEYARQALGLQVHPYDCHTQPLMENLAWLPGAFVQEQQSSFPTNLGHSHNMTEGNNICEHCFIAFQKNHSFTTETRFIDTHLTNAQPCMEQLNMVNEYVGSFPNSYFEGLGTRDPCMADQDLKLEHGFYINEQNEQQHSFYNEYDRGWAAQNHHITHRLDNMQTHDNGAGQLDEHHIVDGSMANVPFMHRNASNGHLLPSNYISHDDTSYLRHGTNIGNEVYIPQQTVGGVTGTYEQGLKEPAIVYRNQPFLHGAESPYHVSKNSQPSQPLWRRRHVPINPVTLCEPSSLMMANGGEAGFMRAMHEGSPRVMHEGSPRVMHEGSPRVMHEGSPRVMHEGSPRFMHEGSPRVIHEGSPRLQQVHVEGQIPNALLNVNNSMSQRIVPFQDSVISDSAHQYGNRQNTHNLGQEDSFSLSPVSFDAGVQHPPIMTSDLALSMNAAADRNLTVDVQQREHEGLENPDKKIVLSSIHRQSFAFDTNMSQISEVEEGKSKLVDANSDVANAQGSQEKLDFVPELIASVKKAVIHGAEAMATELDVSTAPGELLHECEPEDTNGDDQPDSEGNVENEKLDKIEPTSAEAEALEKGLQTIKNDDLEEIKELGSGSFGSVYHGKWRGCDVAIKRIKASCFTGKPSERDRLIADFWKEALMMSSLHHPNVVSFYGVVRDGPDCSLATVTEYMVNGSLKQFLQKKDRTIDRRKRLIIAMDVSFGMEYLHGKNIVHFDLKCENLLVNMRDPQRPVCKIGDLGLSKVKHQTMVSGGLRGTLPWMAPELLSGKSHMVSEKIDVYSYGIVMWELLTGEEPYSGMHCASIIGGIVNDTMRPQSPTWCDPEWKSLMENCWSSDPTSRPSFSEIAQKLRKMAAAINLR